MAFVACKKGETYLPESIEGLPSKQQGDGRILKISYLLENYIGTDD
jgi:hypothetical protein